MASFLNENYDSEEEDDDYEANGDENEMGDDQGSENEGRRSRSKRGPEPEEDDEDEDEEDDEDDEEDEEDEMPQRKKARRAFNPFIETEAAVDEEEEEGEEDEDDLNREDGFIADQAEGDVPESRDDYRHRMLDRERDQQRELDLEAIAEDFRARHSGRAARGHYEAGPTPKRLLLPDVTDPNIWGVKCKPGKEREVVYSIMRKVDEAAYTKRPLKIISAFERSNSMQGYVYVEARQLNDVLVALQGITNCYASPKSLLVPVKEMPDLLHVVKKPEIQAGTWARFKRGKYAGDLVQIDAVQENGLEVRIRMIPRIEFSQEDLAGKRKRPPTNSAANRPPQRLFSEVEAKKHTKYISHSLNERGKRVYTYMGEEYEDGYLVKDVKLSAITTEDVNPTLEEVTRFKTGADDTGADTLDLSQLAASIRASSGSSNYQPGDIVEIYEGEQQGVSGEIVTITGDIVKLSIKKGDLAGTTMEVPSKGLRKMFTEGDHVKVTGGSRYKDEVGMVVRIVEDRVTLLSDVSMQEITVFSKDLKKASDGMSHGSGRYDLHDLIQLDASTVACIVKVDRESLTVIDQNGSRRTIMPSTVMDKIINRRGVATDRNGSEIRVGDTVKEVIGEARTGTILHIYHSFAFLHNREQTQDTGIFVTRTNNVATIAAKGGRIQQSVGPDLTKMNPALQRNQMMPPPIVAKIGGRDRTIGQTVSIKQGPYKGSMGIVKDATDKMARVELHARNKIVTIEKMKLGFRDPVTGGSMSYEAFAAPRGKGAPSPAPRTPRSTWSGSRTPVPDFSGGRTPAWAGAGGGGRTPAWLGSDGGKTPAYGSGSKTPAWGDGSRSAYAGNRTPAWNAGSRTPYISGAGGDGERSAWDAGSKTPGRSAMATSQNDARTPAFSAPTPGPSTSDFASAPTPGALNAPTPAPLSAPTPGPTPFSAPTPGPYNSSWNDSAPTPGVYSAPTPGATRSKGYYENAPTPAAYTAKTPGAWNDADEDEGPRYDSPSP